MYCCDHMTVTLLHLERGLCGAVKLSLLSLEEDRCLSPYILQ